MTALPGDWYESWGWNTSSGQFYESRHSCYTHFSEYLAKGLKDGDVVGACLNSTTRKGFCTLNGERLDIGKLTPLVDSESKNNGGHDVDMLIDPFRLGFNK